MAGETRKNMNIRTRATQDIIHKLKREKAKAKKNMKEKDSVDSDLKFIKDPALRARLRSQIKFYTHHRRDKKR